MYLQSIKLSGFKSFVDITSIPISSQLTGIVGPNGCGKSNIIDAVRWVLGGTSHDLRGENSNDVIFNGSTSRKPVGQAAVELCFDNNDASLSGGYANYPEIIIRRQVSRDGQSKYYLNGTLCRRRDITDIFLGTGLGPRSYAIIEQNTISRLIEAKPEELRIYLEEAAGISKYKERRRETELRIKHTRDNLERLNDLRGELAKQLEHLQQQAEVAEHYKLLKEEERLLQAQLWILYKADIDQQLVTIEKAIEEQQSALEIKLAEGQSISAKQERLRIEHGEYSYTYQNLQDHYYKLGVEVARYEQAVQHNREKIQQLQLDITQVQQASQVANQHLHEDSLQAGELKELIAQLETQVEQCNELYLAANQRLQVAENRMSAWQVKWDEFNLQVAQCAQDIQISQTQIQHLEQTSLSLQERVFRLEQEKLQLTAQNSAEQGLSINQELANLESQQETLQSLLSTNQEQIQQNRKYQVALIQELEATRQDLHALHNRQASLNALQQVALGQTDQAVINWLEKKAWDRLPRFAQQLKVESGWEIAVETVLEVYLQAVCSDDVEQVIEAIQHQQPQGSIAFWFAEKKDVSIEVASEMLLGKVQAPGNLASLLQNIWVAEDVASARDLLSNLPSTASVITRDGVWLGHHWLRITRLTDATAGVLQRDKELLELRQLIEQTEQQLNQRQVDLVMQQDKLHELEISREHIQSNLNNIVAELSDKQSQLKVQQSKFHQREQRIVQIEHEWQADQNQLLSLQQQLEVLRHSYQQAIERMSQHSKKRDVLTLEKDKQNNELNMLRQQAMHERDKTHQIALQLQSYNAQLSTINQQIERTKKQLEQLALRKHALEQISILPEQELKQNLEQALQARLLVERDIIEIKQKLANIEEEQVQVHQHAKQLETIILQIRSYLEQQRMQWQGLQVRSAHYQEQLSQMHLDIDELKVPSDANIDGWEQHLQKIKNRIERMGLINLAAIDECAKQSERKSYLDTQNDDLMAALNTLEDAIRKIDKETKAKFEGTFEKVNQSFQQLFPSLFGGGQAYLELTGNDLLTTGIAVFARPPGKRNSSIQLLSGGEKALTAVALVFAIFQLNPAPFCLLDEVDAPLDDANVGRFCQLVKEMSNKVQFIFVSHNKVTMEMAQHLLGVTMREPGVSRLVAVDVDEAVALAAA